MKEWLTISDEVRAAKANRKPLVALESTLIAHGLPWPINLETALAAEQAVRAAGGVPATIAVWMGKPTVGLSTAQLEELARASNVMKASRRDLATAVAQDRMAATTVAATMHLAHQAGIRIFATGGIGGAHRDRGQPFDISADLVELARTPVLVVCAGAKSILDLPRTLEILETLGVPVIGFQTNEFPAFYSRTSGLPVSTRVDSPEEAARVFATHVRMGGGGAILAQPVATEFAIPAEEVETAVTQAEAQAADNGVRGAALTPFLLSRLAELTHGRSLLANQSLIVANGQLAAEVARCI
ncbi:MAG TPA: pseudouridine-5'-phosphate glycosidase [Gemmataceae bacterium]|jgi:pseudouridine-5'-phosphate glycosidase|nr:pseudouridine-5'-phosphate glycosidase [Gemmataceae bacterium]